MLTYSPSSLAAPSCSFNYYSVFGKIKKITVSATREGEMKHILLSDQIFLFLEIITRVL